MIIWLRFDGNLIAILKCCPALAAERTRCEYKHYSQINREMSPTILTEFVLCFVFRLSSYGQYVIMLTTMFVTLFKVCYFTRSPLFLSRDNLLQKSICARGNSYAPPVKFLHHAGPGEGTKLHARKNFCVFYPIELKLCTMIELFIPNNGNVFVF